MSNFEPTKNHVRGALLFSFHLKKSAIESHRMLIEAYGDNAPSLSTCKLWFRRFKSGDFGTDDKERPGKPRKFEDEELKALINENPSHTLNELAEAFNVSTTSVSKRLKEMQITQKNGIWVMRDVKSDSVPSKKPKEK